MTYFNAKDFYTNLFTLAYDHKINLEYIENLYVFEYEVFMALLQQRLQDELMKAQQQALSSKVNNLYG